MMHADQPSTRVAQSFSGMSTKVLALLRPRLPTASLVIKGDDDVRQFLRGCVPNLRDASDADIDVKFLAGGLTNTLYHASHAASNSHIVVRKFGEGTETFIDRDAEEFWLSAFLQTYGRCANGLAYEFLTGYETAKAEWYVPHRCELARAIANLHHRATMYGHAAVPFATAPNFCMNVQLGRFWTIAKDPKMLEKIPPSANLTEVMDALPAAVDRVRAGIEAFQHLLVVGPCHNDLNIANTMISPDGGIRFIDFEYTQRNFLLYDIANHFNEYAGFDGQWTWLLTQDQKREFLRAYHEELAKLSFGGEVDVQGDFAAELAMVEYLELASHVGWVAWSIAQAANSSIDFDFVKYAAQRLRRYHETVDSVEAAVKVNVFHASTSK
jgi:ethanolamine kinase